MFLKIIKTNPLLTLLATIYLATNSIATIKSSTLINIYNVKSDVTISAEVDTRVFTKDGRKDIAEDIERTKRLGKAVADVATEETFELQDTLDHIDEVQKSLDVDKEFATNDKGKNIAILDNKDGKYSIKERNKALNEYAQIYAKTFGISIKDAKLVAIKKYKGKTYTNKEKTNSTIYVNNNSNNGALKTANTMGHEGTHARIRQGKTRDRKNKVLNEKYANNMGSYSSDGMEFSSSNYNNVKLNHNQPKIKIKRSKEDKKILKENTKNLRKNVKKANKGVGTIDNMGDNEVVDREIIKAFASITPENKKAIAKALGKALKKATGKAKEELIKVIDEFSGSNDANDLVNAMKNGNLKKSTISAILLINDVFPLGKATKKVSNVTKEVSNVIGKIFKAIKNGRKTKSLKKLSKTDKKVDIPDKVNDLLDDIAKKKGSTRLGYKGNKMWKNRNKTLPTKDKNNNPITYKEYDVNPKPLDGTKRDSERIVIGSDGKKYYTNDHYETFKEIR